MGATPWRFKSSPGHHLTRSLMDVRMFIFVYHLRAWSREMYIILVRAENGAEEEQSPQYVYGAYALTVNFDQATRIREKM